MKKFNLLKKAVATLLAMVMMVGMGSTVFAEGGDAKEYVDTCLASAMKDSSWQFTEVSFTTTESKMPILKTIQIPFVGLSTFLTLDIVNTEMMEYHNSNPDVVTIIPEQNWRILAKDCGTSILTLDYNGNLVNLEIIVENRIDEAIFNEKMKLEELQRSNDTERTAIVSKGRAMTYVEWMPTGDLVKWGSTSSTKKYFTKSKWNYGIPYTQNVQCDEKSFISSMSKADFYSPVTIKNNIAPRYGNDCSGFLSLCWGITRINTVEFKRRIDNGTYKQLGAYSDLKNGDAVWVSGHVFMILQNWITPPSGSSYSESYVSSYEQTPSNAQLTFFTYKQLNNQGYIPFSKFM